MRHERARCVAHTSGQGQVSPRLHRSVPSSAAAACPLSAWRRRPLAHPAGRMRPYASDIAAHLPHPAAHRRRTRRHRRHLIAGPSTTRAGALAPARAVCAPRSSGGHGHDAHRPHSHPPRAAVASRLNNVRRLLPAQQRRQQGPSRSGEPAKHTLSGRSTGQASRSRRHAPSSKVSGCSTRLIRLIGGGARIREAGCHADRA